MKIIQSNYDSVSNWLSEVPEPKEETDMKSEELFAKKKNVSIEEAKKACATIRKQIKDAFPESTPEEIEGLLSLKINTSGGTVTGDKTDVTLVAVGPYKDLNLPRKKSALNKYRDNPEDAVNHHNVRLDENKQPVPIESTEYFGKEGDPTRKKNPNYLKDIQDDVRREAIFVTSDGKHCVFGVGKFDGDPGDIASIVGRVTPDKITVYKKGWKVTEHLTAEKLWDRAYDALADSDMSVPIESVWDTEKNKVVAIKGNIAMAAVTRDGAGGAMFRITEAGLDEDIACFGDEADDYLKGLVDNLEKGMEVIAFGSVNKYTSKENEERKNINLIGMIINPRSSELAAALSKIPDIDF